MACPLQQCSQLHSSARCSIQLLLGLRVKSNWVVGLIERLRVRWVLLRRREPWSAAAAAQHSRYLKAQAEAQAIRAGRELAQAQEPVFPLAARWDTLSPATARGCRA